MTASHLSTRWPLSRCLCLFLSLLLTLYCLGWSAHAVAQVNLKDGELRGELLYVTHCNACHTYEIHWRKQKLVIDWASLVDQVRRWQAGMGLGWTDEEVADVARYLNAVHYGFSVPARKGYSRERKTEYLLHQ